MQVDLQRVKKPIELEIQEEERLLCSLGLRAGSCALSAQFSELNSYLLQRYPSAWFWQDAPTRLSVADLLADLKCLRFAMERAYIGWEMAEESGWDWKEFFLEWAERLLQSGTQLVSWSEAFEPWQDLMRHQLDNHSGP